MAGRKHRPSISFRQATVDRLTHAAKISGVSRTSLAETAIREYLDSIGIPREAPTMQRERAPQEHPTSSPARGGGVHFL